MTEYPKEIIQAVNAVMQEVGYVQKKDRNAFQNYKYAGEAAVLAALRPRWWMPDSFFSLRRLP